MQGACRASRAMAEETPDIPRRPTRTRTARTATPAAEPAASTPDTPAATPRVQKDFSELRNKAPKRNRAKVDRELQIKQARQQAARVQRTQALQRKSERRRAGARARGVFNKRRLKAVLWTLLSVSVIAGAGYWYTHPHLSLTQLKAGALPITVYVQKTMGADAKLVRIREQADAYVLEYTFPKGQEGYRGYRTLRTCTATATVLKLQRLPITKYSSTAERCSFAKTRSPQS
jgi:hypothetical protein